jgi:hypothetical protein
MRAEQPPRDFAGDIIMLNTDALNTAIAALVYPTRTNPQVPGLSAQLRREYNTALSALIGEWVEYLADEYGYDLPADAQSAIYGKAWSDGHSSGYQEVEHHYSELADLARRIRKA